MGCGYLYNFYKSEYKFAIFDGQYEGRRPEFIIKLWTFSESKQI